MFRAAKKYLKYLEKFGANFRDAKWISNEDFRVFFFFKFLCISENSTLKQQTHMKCVDDNKY